MHSILLIDDDTELCDLLDEYLNPEGFCVFSAHDGKKGMTEALSGKYDIVILDIMLPGLNEFEILSRLRTHSTVPVIMLTARGEEVDRIVGLEMGADDYLPKPFNPRELVARVRAVMRRMPDKKQNELRHSFPGSLIAEDLELDCGKRTLLKSGVKVNLTVVEFNLLENLLRHAGQTVLREDLVRCILGRDLSPYDRSIDVHISNLRRKIGQDSSGNERIRTIRGVGYLYIQPSVNGQ